MALLSDEDRREIWAEYMSAISDRRESMPNLGKRDLRAAFDAADVWYEAKKASYNADLPEPARTELTPTQKAEILERVIKKHREKGV